MDKGKRKGLFAASRRTRVKFTFCTFRYSFDFSAVPDFNNNILQYAINGMIQYLHVKTDTLSLK